MAIPPLIGNPYSGYINPYYWVDDHPLLYGNNGSLDPSTYTCFCFFAVATCDDEIHLFDENCFLLNNPIFEGDFCFSDFNGIHKHICKALRGPHHTIHSPTFLGNKKNRQTVSMLQFFTSPSCSASCLYMGVSKNRGGPPKSFILIGFSIINHPFWGPTPIFGNIHINHSISNHFKEGYWDVLLLLSKWMKWPLCK